jgi:hypothetical protein
MATSQQSESSALGGPLKASPEESGLADANLRALEAAIRLGDFKKDTSVLIARQGKLAYEEYFEGDANTQPTALVTTVQENCMGLKCSDTDR